MVIAVQDVLRYVVGEGNLWSNIALEFDGENQYIHHTKNIYIHC
jgi:hypothetical protein